MSPFSYSTDFLKQTNSARWILCGWLLCQDCHEAPSSGAHEEQDTIAKHTAQEQDKEALVASSSDASAERRPQVSAKLLATGGTDTSKAVVAVMKCSATAMHVIVESFKGLLYAVLLSAEDRIVHRNMC